MIPNRYPPRYPLDNSLQLYLPMDRVYERKVLDISGKGNHGTLYGPTWEVGPYGPCLGIDDVDDYIEVANSASLNPTYITAGCWAKSNTATWTAYGTLLSKRDVYILAPGASYRAVSFYVYIDGAWTYVDFTGFGDITKWHYYEGTWDGSAVKIYADGILRNSASATGTLNTTDTGNLYIGQDDGHADRHLNGLIGPVRISNRAKPPWEVKRSYELDKAYGWGRVVNL